MADLSTLCPACTKALYTENSTISMPRDNVFDTHHSTHVSFLDAVKHGCFICRTVWENVDSQRQMMPTTTTTTAFRLYRRMDGQGLRLVIAFRCHPQKLALETKFQLLPNNSKCDQMLPSSLLRWRPLIRNTNHKKPHS